MLARIVSLFLLSLVIYVLSVFLFPAAADKYGNPWWNQRIRVFKSSLESYTGTSTSLFDTLQTTTKGVVNEARMTTDTITITLDHKIQDIQKSAQSVSVAVDALKKAKSDIEQLTDFSSGIVWSGTLTH